MTRLAFITGATLLVALPVLSGCKASSSVPNTVVTPPTPTPAGTLPIKASGRALAFRSNATNTSSINSYTTLPSSTHQIKQASILERAAAGGIRINGSADKDSNAVKNQGANPALISASSPDTLQGGTALAGMTDAKGNVYFENGNFGDAQASNDMSNLSSVGVYNVYKNNTFVEQIVMKHGTTIRYQEGKAGDGTAIYAVGYIGNNTAQMPTSGQATYKGFHEGGTSVYDDNGTMQQLGLRDGTVELTADFAAGTMTGGISGAQLVTYKNNAMTVLNPDVTGLEINATIVGSEYNGTAQLVDKNKNPVGTTVYNESIGAFFGDDAAETAAAYVIEGNAALDGQNRDYLMSGDFGGVKK